MIKKLLANVGDYKKASLLTPVYVAGEVALDVIMPLIMAMMIDQGIEKGHAGVILRYGGLLFLCSLLALMLGTLGGRTAAIASAGFARNLRHNLFSKIQDFSFSNIDRFSSSSLITRMTTDVTNVQNAYQMIIRILVRSPLILVFSLIMVSTISPELMLVYLVVLPILAIGLALVIRFAHPLFLKVFRIYDRLNNVVQENLQGIRVVKSYVREEQQEELFDEVSNDVYRNFTLAQRIVSFNMPLMQFSIYSCMLLLSWFGAQLIVEHSSLTTGELVSMFNYTMQILMSLMMMSMAFVQILIARTSAQRVVIPRLYDVIDGRVLVGGQDVRAYDLAALRDQVSMVLQNNVLFSGTISENLRWGNAEATDEEIQRVAKIAQADPFIQEFPDKYDTLISQGGNNVSGGQKQRLTIARALLKRPKILILDDSTSAVDTKTDRSIRAGLKQEIPGTTTIIISQRINSIEDADRIIVMDDGKINGIGTHEELLTSNEIYREVYDSQQKGFGEGEE